MRAIRPWLVPLFLLALGVAMIWLSSGLYSDGLRNLALENSSDCSVPTGFGGGPPTCGTSTSNAEMVDADLIGWLGGLTLMAGIVVSLARTARTWRPATVL